MATRKILFSAQKDEGPFLLEWVAYHKVVGFTEIVIYSNNCTDGSDDLLDRLAEAGEVHHVRQTVPAGASPQINAGRLLLESGRLGEGDWVMWLDSDEYLLVRTGAGDVDSLIASLPDADAIGVAWRVFGSAGQETWPGEQIGRPFVRASRRQWPPNTQIKTLFRYDRRIAALDIHRPVYSPDVAPASVGFFGSNGLRLPGEFVHQLVSRGYPIHRLARSGDIHTLAQVNHYAVRTPDMYARKKGRGRGLGSAIDSGVRHTEEFFRDYDNNLFEDSEILRHYDAKRLETERLRAIVG